MVERTVVAAEVLLLVTKFQITRQPKFPNLPQGVSSSSNSLVARSAVPDTSGLTLDRVLSAEGAGVTSVLLGLHLSALSSQRRTVTNTVLSSDSDLLSALSPKELVYTVVQI